MTGKFEANRQWAEEMDRKDPLGSFRDRFHIPPGTIYADGNSLGLLSKDSEECLLRVLGEWKVMGIDGWLRGDPPWFYTAEKLGEMVAPMVGAEADEVVATGTTTVNIHSLVSTFYDPDGQRTKILADELNFPTDIYALQGLIGIRGYDPEEHLILVPSEDGLCLDEDRIIDMMTDQVALVHLPSVLYRSGQLLDIKRLTREAHRRNIPISWDCSHSVGTVPHRFDEWDVDCAMWCSYKYLNGGPGGTAFLYVNRRHFDTSPRLPGWFGYVKDKQFDLRLDFQHQRSAGGWQISSPGILSAAPVEGGLRISMEAGIQRIREKSMDLTSYFIYLVDELLSEGPYNFKIGSPRDPTCRSGHVALIHETDAWRISQALKARGVIVDFRPPNVIRVAPAALYCSYSDVYDICKHLLGIIDKREHEGFTESVEAVS